MLFLLAYCNNSTTLWLEGGILKPQQQRNPGISYQWDLPRRSNMSESC